MVKKETDGQSPGVGLRGSEILFISPGLASFPVLNITSLIFFSALMDYLSPNIIIMNRRKLLLLGSKAEELPVMRAVTNNRKCPPFLHPGALLTVPETAPLQAGHPLASSSLEAVFPPIYSPSSTDLSSRGLQPEPALSKDSVRSFARPSSSRIQMSLLPCHRGLVCTRSMAEFNQGLT